MRDEHVKSAIGATTPAPEGANLFAFTAAAGDIMLNRFTSTHRRATLVGALARRADPSRHHVKTHVTSLLTIHCHVIV